MDGTPVEVPVPRKVNFIDTLSLQFTVSSFQSTACHPASEN
jgi:hypothetical protein